MACLVGDPTREGKAKLLAELRDRGIFLIDLKEDPVDGMPLREYVPRLVDRCRALNPRKIILITATVFDAAYVVLKQAGLPVSPVRVPFPGSGRQREFEVAFQRAIDQPPPLKIPFDPFLTRPDNGTKARL